MKRKDFEVMAQVGSYESLEAALQAGANSVYFGAVSYTHLAVYKRQGLHGVEENIDPVT